jgi:hypothetical protein
MFKERHGIADFWRMLPQPGAPDGTSSMVVNHAELNGLRLVFPFSRQTKFSAVKAWVLKHFEFIFCQVNFLASDKVVSQILLEALLGFQDTRNPSGFYKLR